MQESLIACAACGRSNGEERGVCLYCGATMLGEAARRRAEIERLVPPRRRGGERHMVTVLPGQHDESRARDLARIYQIDVHAADQILRRPVPVTEELPSGSRAAATLQLLEKADIGAVAFSQRDLDVVPPCKVPACVEVFGNEDGQHLRVTLDEEVEARVPVEALRFATLGRLVLRTVTREPRPGSPARTLSEERLSVLDLYGDSVPPLRLLEGHTRVEGLGLSDEQRALSFGLLRARLEEVRGDLAFDEGHRFDALRAAEGHTALGYPYLVAPVGEPRFPARFVIHTTHDWDEWSARAWVVFQRESGA